MNEPSEVMELRAKIAAAEAAVKYLSEVGYSSKVFRAGVIFATETIKEALGGQK